MKCLSPVNLGLLGKELRDAEIYKIAISKEFTQTAPRRGLKIRTERGNIHFHKRLEGTLLQMVEDMNYNP